MPGWCVIAAPTKLSLFTNNLEKVVSMPVTVMFSVPIPMISLGENPLVSVTKICVLNPVIVTVSTNVVSPTDLLMTCTF